MKSKLSLVLLFCFINIIAITTQRCELRNGCILRTKFFVYNYFQSQEGTAVPLKSAMNYKIIYLYKDRLIVYTSAKSTENGAELESFLTKKVDEMNIERIVNFAEIILDCGKYNNELCIAQSYPTISTLPFFSKIKQAIPTNPDVKCIIIPFFENSYKMSHEKLTFICINEIRQLPELIDFKNTLSRSIESYQMRLADDRFSSFNGIRRYQGSFIYFDQGKPKSAILRLFGKKVSILTNDKAMSQMKEFSLYQSRKNGVYYVKDAIKLKLLPANWNESFEKPATEDCCIALPGDTDNLIFCAASNDQKKLESSTDICKVKLEPARQAMKRQIKPIRLSEAHFSILNDSRVFGNCKAKEFKIFKDRVLYSITKKSIEDCTLYYNYLQTTAKKKFDICFKNYGDTMKMEIDTLSMGNSSMYNKLSDCFYKDKDFTAKLSSVYLKKLLGFGKKKKSSFMETSEVDEIDDDDSIINNNTTPISQKPLNKSEKTVSPQNQISLAQVKETITNSPSKFLKKKKPKVKMIDKIKYNKKKLSNSDLMRSKLFRIGQINRLQNNHHWRNKVNESMDGKFSKIMAVQGNKNADLFVSFLGFMRDKAYSGNQNVYAVETDKFFQ